MKKLLFLLLVTLNVSLQAQDRVITKYGDIIEAYRIDVSNSFIYYTLQNNDKASLKKIAKEEVLMIKKQDGSIINLYDKNQTQNETASKVPDSKKLNTSDAAQNNLTPETENANNMLITQYNKDVDLETTENDKGKKAKETIAFFGVKKNSTFISNDIEITATIGTMFKESKKAPAVFHPKDIANGNPALQFSIKNKTNRTIYVDLGNTFLVTMGESVCYYIPSSTTNSAASSSGGSLNLGVVANVLGIGGSAGTLANGINVMQGSTDGSSSTIYTKRIVAIAPMSSLSLPVQYMFGNKAKEIRKYLHYVSTEHASYNYYLFAFFNKKNLPHIGDHYTYSEESSPMNFSFIVSYSESEDCQELTKQAVHFYLKDLWGYKNNAQYRNLISNYNQNLKLNIEVFEVSPRHTDSYFPIE